MNGTRSVAPRQRHPFMVTAGWAIAIALILTVVPCCLIYLSVRAACRVAYWRITRVRVPGNLQQ